MTTTQILDRLVDSLDNIRHNEDNGPDWIQCPSCNAKLAEFGSEDKRYPHEPDCALQAARKHLRGE